MYDQLAKYYNHFFTFDEKNIKSFYTKLSNKPGKTLDLGCGTGRLTNVLYDLYGHSVGIDLDDEMLSISKNGYPHIEFIKADMIQFLKQYKNTLNVITCYGNTLAHIKPKDVIQLFKYAHQALTDDGYLCIQLLNYEHILKQKITKLPTLSYQDMSLERNYTYLDDMIQFQTVFHKNNRSTILGTHILYPHKKDNLMKMSAMLFEASFYTSHQKEPYQSQSSHVLCVFKKKNQ